jgi:leucyl/phenylalanyl-tRNA--protein transferase
MQLEKDKLYEIPKGQGFPEDLEAISINLSPELVLLAYPQGLFPWHQDEKYFYWFSPDPRMILYPEKVKVSKSMRNVLNRGQFKTTINLAFQDVIKNCMHAERKGQDETWITDDFVQAYTQLHDMGFALSIEAWNSEGDLVGGLYGILMYNIFFGESMFSLESNASKVCFIKLCKDLNEDIKFVDCQAVNAHLKTLGAEEISKVEFETKLKETLKSFV